MENDETAKVCNVHDRRGGNLGNEELKGDTSIKSLTRQILGKFGFEIE